MIRLSVPAAVLGLIAALSFAACGSSSDNAPTKAEYIKKADAICTKGNQQIDAEAKKTFGKNQPTQAQLSAFDKKTVLPALDQMLGDLRALDRPKGDDAAITAMYDSLDSAIQNGKKNGITDATFKDANQKAIAYGLKVCGK